jgi:diguanylate cyclase (GGDEF)-like protein
MSHFTFNRKRARLRKLLGIRARLAVLALIVVAPLMLDRARSLEEGRRKQIAQASQEFSELAQNTADTQREVISSVETMLKSAAYIRASAGGVGRSCDIMRASVPINLPWITSLMIAGGDGHVQCATRNELIGLDLSGRAYFQKAKHGHDVVFSDFLFAIATDLPIVIAAYPVSAIRDDSDAVIVAGVSLNWLSKIMGNLGDRPGISGVLIDSTGVVLAAPPDAADMVGHSLDSIPLLSSIASRAIDSSEDKGSISFVAADGSSRVVNFARIPGTQSRLIISIDESKVTAAINRDIRTAYLQLGFVCLFVLLGALVAAEKLIINPIDMMAAMAKRFGQGDRTARVAHNHLPSEFVPLARAFNAMAAQLGERERELIATNDRLTVMASIDMLSGLANRRGFQSRLDVEWMKAQQHNSELSLLMIDVDHFKLFNDTYGHPEGDACLSKLGETLAGIAADNMGIAGRYGGEEFCLLLPNTDTARALEIGELVRKAVWDQALPHSTSAYQTVTVSVGVASSQPNDTQRPGDLIEAADAALYAAKRRGRNAVVEHGFVRATESGNGMAMAS